MRECRLLAAKTAREYGYWVGGVARVVDDLDSADRACLYEYLTSLPLSPSLRNGVRAALVAYFEFRKESGERDDNPAKDLPRVKNRPSVPRPVERMEAQALIRRAYLYSPLFGCLVTLYLHTGLRRIELTERRWEDLIGRNLFVVTKGGYQETAYLNDDCIAAIGEWRLECSSHVWMFPSPRLASRPITANWIGKKIRELGLDAGIAGFTLHRTRHTYATCLLEDTGDIELVRRALRHKSLASTQRYAQLADHKIQQALEQLRY
jgi:integrase